MDSFEGFAKNGEAVRSVIPLLSFRAPNRMQATQSRGTTVVIPVYNGERYLAEALASIADQTHGASEIVVVDDGSTDGTPEIVRSHRDVSYVRQQNAGVAAALNHGIRVANGAFIAFLSADDIWKDDKLALQHDALQNAPNCLIFGHMLHFISPELEPNVAKALVCPAGPMPAYSAGTLLTRLDTFRAVGPFNEDFAVGEFMDWYSRARSLGANVTMLDEVVSMRRVHSDNHSTKMLRKKSYAPVLKALLNRRRTEGGGP
jgi:glycosyltransferase involved in cell wall biosynthesis